MLALGCTFVACSDDDDDNAFVSDGHPEKAAAGTYEGTWLRVYDGDSVYSDGTITVTATDSAYCADFAFYCEEFELDVASVANISYAGSSSKFVYANSQSDGNALGTNFAGTIDGSVATARFTFTQKVGRKSYEYVYRFNLEK